MKIYRYLNREFVDAFFDTGKLMLSSFDRCRTLEDARGDPREGKANFFVKSGEHAVSGGFNSGRNTRLLCGSRVLSSTLMEKFGVDDYFIIRRPLHFLYAVSDCIPDVISFHCGDVIYEDNGIETANEESPFLPFDFHNPDEDAAKEWFDAQNRHLSQWIHQSVGNSGWFTKRHTPYHDEFEYRFTWTLATLASGSLLVDCTKALEYCSRR